MKPLPILLAAAFSLSVAATTAPAQVSATDSYQAESAILSAGSRASAVSRLKKVGSVGVIRLYVRTTPTRYQDYPGPEEFEISAAKNMSGIKKLRAALSANPATRAVLAKRGIPVSRVVGINIYSNGSIRLYLL